MILILNDEDVRRFWAAVDKADEAGTVEEERDRLGRAVDIAASLLDAPEHKD